MYPIKNNKILTYNEAMLDELYNAGVLINATKCCCQEREFRGEYYGIPDIYTDKISNERNEYLSLLSLLSDKINHINKLNLRLCKEVSYINTPTIAAER